MPSYKALYNREPNMKKEGNALNQQQARPGAPATPLSRQGMQRVGASPQALARAQQLTVPKSQMYRQAAAQTKGQEQSQGPTLAPGGPGGSVYDPSQGLQEKAVDQALQQVNYAYHPGTGSGFDPNAPGEAPVPVSAAEPEDTRDKAEGKTRELMDFEARSTEEEEALAQELADYYLGEQRRDAASRGGAFGLGGANIAMDNDLREQARLDTLREQVGWRQDAREEELARNLAGLSGFGSMRGQDLAEAKHEAMQDMLNDLFGNQGGGEGGGRHGSAPDGGRASGEGEEGEGGEGGEEARYVGSQFDGDTTREIYSSVPDGATNRRSHDNQYDVYDYNGSEILVKRED